MKLTKLENTMIEDIVKSCYRGGYLADNDPVWVFDVVDSPQKKGVISSLSKKSVVNVTEWDDGETVVSFTDAGLKIAIAMFPEE